MHGPQTEPLLHGVMAEFRTPEELLEAIGAAKAAGFTKLDAYTPYPIEKVLDALDLHHSKLPLLVLGASIVGAVGVFGFAYWASAIDYPLNIGGRPLNSWPAFIPATFEGAIFHGGLAAALGMLLLNGLPRPHHPVFNVPALRRARLQGRLLPRRRIRRPEVRRPVRAAFPRRPRARGGQRS